MSQAVVAGGDNGPMERVPVVLVTGMSGAGKSTALKVLEDLGYEAIDNLPLYLLSRLLAPKDDGLSAAPLGAVAVDVDIRTRGFDADAFLSEITLLETVFQGEELLFIPFPSPAPLGAAQRASARNQTSKVLFFL